MPKVKLNTPRATINRSNGAGETIEVDKDEARRLIDSGQAESVEGEKYPSTAETKAADEKRKVAREKKKKEENARKKKRKKGEGGWSK